MTIVVANNGMGVCLIGAQVHRTGGIIMKTDSSAKTRWAPSRVAFFYPRPALTFPLLDLSLIAFERTTLRLLATEIVQPLFCKFPARWS